MHNHKLFYILFKVKIAYFLFNMFLSQSFKAIWLYVIKHFYICIEKFYLCSHFPQVENRLWKLLAKVKSFNTPCYFMPNYHHCYTLEKILQCLLSAGLAQETRNKGKEREIRLTNMAHSRDSH